MAGERGKGAAVGYINIIATTIINLLYTPLLIRMLGQDDYGVFQMTNSVVQALLILTMGFDFAYVKFYSAREAKHAEKEIWKLNGMYLIIFIAIAALAVLCGCVLFTNVDFLFSKGLDESERKLAKKLIAIMVYSVAISFPGTVFDSYIMVHERFVFQQSRQLATSIAVPVLAVFSLYLGFGAVGVASAKAIMSTILLLLNMNYAVRKLRMRFSFSSFDSTLFKSLASFSFWIFLNQIFDIVNSYAPNFLLGALSSARTVAVFAVALQIRSLFMPLSTVLMNVFVPKINRIVATSNDDIELTQLMTHVGRYQMIVFCFLYCGFIVVGKYFITIWAGSGFDDAYLMILIMTLPQIFDLTQNTGMAIQRARNKQKARSLAYVVTAFLNILISVVFIPKYGYWATTIGYVVSVVLSTGVFMNWYFQFRLGLSMKYFWAKMVPTLVTSAAVTVICLLLTTIIPVISLKRFLFMGCLYVFLYSIASWLFVLSKDERQFIQKKFVKHQR
ncbi:oligosaccharide flippase family protein [Bifidobacterium sp. ESL0732]|uniref:oligosaccharide flippase family protein n=1 Tax=Bifidobacterium sp. ESL0732 TaxID=2983222 RepID=UPI0023F7DA10|nr:oligosaccharide flippase family protein [Bifidobacterium sp. ESL0732]WEV64335.1 oligosaccharide flippase family protein [Bifidobacterium sp. ESL0732]